VGDPTLRHLPKRDRMALLWSVRFFSLKLTLASPALTIKQRSRAPLALSTMKIKTLCLAITFLVPSIAAAQTADEIVTKVLAARGGVDKIKEVHSQRILGTIEFAPGASGPFIVELERPGKMHIEVSVQGQTLTRSFDGKSTGWIINPFSPNKGVEPMSAEDISNITDESDFDGPLVDYKSKGNQIELAGKEDVEGKPAYRLKLTSKKGELRSYLVDAGTFQLVRWEGTRKVGDKDVPWESLFRDYRDVNGLMFAFEIDSDAPGTEQSQKIIADKVELNPQIDESHFGKPPAPAAPPEQPANSAPPDNPPPQD
jgi:outer membrane lipoprotein-sorting protein